MNLPENFNGYAGDPSCENDVVFLFGLLYDHLPFPFVVRSIQKAFPDCEGIDPVTRKPVKIEFEFLSSNYRDHGHPNDKRKCDYIVCWEHNWPGSRIPVISLKKIIETKTLEGKRFFDIPAPGSLRERLQGMKENNPQAYAAVNHFLNKLQKLKNRFHDLEVDDKVDAAFNIKYLGKGGLIWVSPNGKLGCGSVDQILRIYHKTSQDAARKMREEVKKVGILSNSKDGDRVAKALEGVLKSIDEP